MEILDAEEAPLSNFEVLQFLKEMEQQQRLRDKVAKKNKTQAIKPSENQATIMFEVRKTLNKSVVKTLTPEAFHAIMLALKPFPLTKTEKLQIMNLRPSIPVELYTIVDDFSNRMNELDMNAIFKILDDNWPLPEPSSAAKGGDDQQAESSSGAVLD